VLIKNNKLADIVRTIKEIDRQHNGFVTSTELDDILKVIYKEELQDKDLKPMLKKYASIQNRILIDYKQFRDSLVKQIKKHNASFTLGTLLDSSLHTSPEQIKKAHTLQGVFDEPTINLALEPLVTLKASTFKQNKSGARTPRRESFGRNPESAQKHTDTLIQIKDLLRPKTRDVV
jgi:reverse gyrase